MKSKIYEPSKEMLSMKAILQELPFGAELTYEDFEKKTGIDMDTRGKSLLRSALRSLNINVQNIRGVGFKLECPENALNIVAGRTRRVSNSVKKGAKVTRTLNKRHADKMEEPDKHRLALTSQLFAMIIASSKSLTSLYGEKPKLVNVDGLEEIKMNTKSLNWRKA